MLNEEIIATQRLVHTDAYQMSIGELVNLYSEGDLTIDPEFQRLFRWEPGQKSKFIESLLLGIPIPSIFVFEKDDARWELIDGLQRVSTILEFMGVLRGPDGAPSRQSYLEATKYLPSLHNVVWEKSDKVDGLPLKEQVELDRTYQLTIRRARIGVEILKRPSDNRTKYDLFQRLNAGGTEANAQELRNCVIIMVNPDYYRAVRELADIEKFREIIHLTEEQAQKQRDIEYAVRFLVHCLVQYDGNLDVEEFIDEGIVGLAEAGDTDLARHVFGETFRLLGLVGWDALRRLENGRTIGRVTLGAFEAIAVGVGRNIDSILSLDDPEAFVREKVALFWERPELETFASPGLRGTTRILRTVTFGDAWFRP